MISFLCKTLIVVGILVLVIMVAYLLIKRKVKRIFKENFGISDIGRVLKSSEEEFRDTPKSLASMERFIIPRLKEDFVDLNILEIKSMAEDAIVKCLNAIEKKDVSEIKGYTEVVVSYIKSIINDLNDRKMRVFYDSIRIHKTVLSKYETNDSIATLYLETSLEYLYKEGNDNYRKVQDRIRTEFIYIIDASVLKGEKVKAIGLNCPNCGAPITSLGRKKCKYCGSESLDIVKRTWNLNNFQLK